MNAAARVRREKVRIQAATMFEESVSTAARPWLTVIRLPAYAPDLDPTEGVWRWMKRGLTNTAARGVDHLAELVKRRLRACQQQTDLLAGFFASTGMTLEPEPPR
ncbi:transposase [Micromonospora sp. NPDC005215]|uniref:transposase n=1 Tax=Micromonospora sp. NPDC005215 TaxID=3157024 RepID=UPI0033AB1C8F